MDHFSNLFGKLKTALENFDTERKVVTSIIGKHCGKAPESSQIEIKDGVVHLVDINPAFKQTVFMKKQGILLELNAQNIKIRDIR